jgi:cytosine/adenosine deaminase-related metal-dependent hydrolase
MTESAVEQAYFSDQAGLMYDFIKARGGECHASPSAVAWLQSQGFLYPASLLVHGNYFSDNDLALIAQWPKACLVHCPGSHAFFGHQDFPFEKVKLKNISVALGTDSLASNTAISLGHEIKLFCQKYPGQTLQTIMPLITTNALRAIGIIDRGQLAIGQKADLSFWKKIDPEKALEAITRQQKPASVMINGVTVQE